ncbi:hypothetical protein MCOR29_010445, partial [Pyricularia oryzae]
MTKDQVTGYGALQTSQQHEAAGASPSSSSDGRPVSPDHDAEVGACGDQDATAPSKTRGGEMLAKVKEFYTRNLGLLFVFLAQG